VDRIGAIFSAGQLAQVAAILAAPIVLRRLGVIGGIAAMEIAAAVSLALLATAPAGLAAALAYAAYMGFQYMSEPGTFSLLMSRVPDRQRSGASALNFFVINSSQAIAAAAAGTMVARAGYEPVLFAAAVLATLAALLFRFLLRPFGGADAP
jgi:predicted MFS family arabinose efflux permease